MATKELTPLEQVLIDTIKKSTDVGGEIYNASKVALSKGIDFAEKQIPDVIEQFLHWHMAQAIVWMIVGIAMLVFAWHYGKKWFDVSDGANLLLCIPMGLASIPVIVANLLDVVYISVAPKVYLLEYIANLIKPNCCG